MAEWIEEMIVQYGAHLAYFVATHEDVIDAIKKQPRTATALARMALKTEIESDADANEKFWTALENDDQTVLERIKRGEGIERW